MDQEGLADEEVSFRLVYSCIFGDNNIQHGTQSLFLNLVDMVWWVKLKKSVSCPRCVFYVL